MDYPRPCGCKGRRTCLACEKEYNFDEKSFINDYKVKKFIHFKTMTIISKLCFSLIV